MIQSENISVVLQGSIAGENKNLTKLCVKSLNAVLPNSEIIISCYEGEGVLEVKNVKYVYSKDPGQVSYIKYRRNSEQIKVYSNVNRQITTSNSGLRIASRNYVLRMRNDIQLLSSDFIKMFSQFTQRQEKYKILKEKVLILNSHSPFVTGFYNSYSDWLQFGLLEDVIKLWDIEHLISKANRNALSDPNPEQYIYLSFLKKFTRLSYHSHYFKPTKEELFRLDLYFINNFIIVDHDKFSINSFKYPNKSYVTSSIFKYVYNRTSDYVIKYKYSNNMPLNYNDRIYIIKHGLYRIVVITINESIQMFIRLLYLLNKKLYFAIRDNYEK